ncbi:MAG: DUF2178 domain-containing protein [Methanobacteriaceae archaeon]
MNMKLIIVSGLSGITSLLWIIGLILADINLFLIAMAVLIINLIIFIKNMDEIKNSIKSQIDDERTEYIKRKSSETSFGVLIALNIYLGVAIITLRNIYPEYLITGYFLIITTVIGLITYAIVEKYYKSKY